MPRTGRPKAELILTALEREQLTRDARRAKSAQALALRSKIVLACADGADNKSVAEQLRCCRTRSRSGVGGSWSTASTG